MMQHVSLLVENIGFGFKVTGKECEIYCLRDGV
jgi:hypothetical protein